MERISGFARILSSGAPAGGAAVNVYLAGTLDPVPLYSDNLSPPTPLANPVTADANGFFFFHTPNALVDLRFSGGGIPTPYTIGDVPAGGIGDGGLLPVSSSSFPAVATQHRGRLRFLTDSVLGAPGVWVQDLAAWQPALDFALSTYARASLPTPGAAGRLRRVSDGPQGLFMDQGAQWDPVLSYAFDSGARAALPTPGLAGRLRRVTDLTRGLWMDQNVQWFSLAHEWVDAREFGARGDGTTDDAAALQAALDAIPAGGGVVVVPGGRTYLVRSPLLVKDRTLVLAYGATFSLPSDFSGDSLFRASRRDDNVAANTDRFWISGAAVTAAHAISAFAALDFTGASGGGARDVSITFTARVSAQAAFRLADRNRAATSSKRCRMIFLSGIAVTDAWVFVDWEQRNGECYGHSISSFDASGLRRGIGFTGTFTQRTRALVAAGRLAGDSTADGSAHAVSTSPPAGAVFLGVEASSFGDGNGGLAASVQFGDTLASAASGTTSSAPVSPGGAVPSAFDGSAYLRIAAGTVVPAGASTYAYTLTSAPAGAAFLVAFVSGLPSASPLAPQASLSGTTLILTIVSGAALTLASDLVLRVVQVAP